MVRGAGQGTECREEQRLAQAGDPVFDRIEGDSVPQLFIPALVNLHRQGRFPLDRLITT